MHARRVRSSVSSVGTSGFAKPYLWSPKKTLTLALSHSEMEKEREKLRPSSVKSPFSG